MVSTCVTVVVALFTTVVDPQEWIEPVVLWQALVVSFLCAALSTFSFPWDRAMKKWEARVRIIAHYLAINLIVLWFGDQFGWYRLDEWISLLAMLISIAAIYVIVSCFSWRKSKQDAQKMNERLMQYRGKKDPEKK